MTMGTELSPSPNPPLRLGVTFGFVGMPRVGVEAPEITVPPPRTVIPTCPRDPTPHEPSRTMPLARWHRLMQLLGIKEWSDTALLTAMSSGSSSGMFVLKRDDVDTLVLALNAFRAANPNTTPEYPAPRYFQQDMAYTLDEDLSEAKAVGEWLLAWCVWCVAAAEYQDAVEDAEPVGTPIIAFLTY